MSKLVPIAAIDTQSFGAGKHLTGQIISIRPYNAGTKLASLQIKSLAPSATPSAAVALSSIDIQLKGKWVAEAIASFSAGQTVIISSEYAKVVAKVVAKVGPGDGKSIFRIEFDGGIKGFIVAADGERTAVDHVNPQDTTKAVTKAGKRLSGEGADPKVVVAATRTSAPSNGDIFNKENQSAWTADRATAAELLRKRSASSNSIGQGGSGPVKNQKVDEVEPIDHSAAKKLEKGAKQDAQRAAQEKASAIAKESKPEGWPSHLSIAAVSTIGAGVGYSDCASFTTKATVDFIGIVTLVVKEPSLIRGTKSSEWGSTFRITDPSASETLDLLFEFRRPAVDSAFLPNPKPGDVMLCRKIKYSWNKATGPKITGFATQFSHHIFPAALLLDSSTKIPLSIASRDKRVAGYNEADLDYARYLVKWAEGKDLEKKAGEIVSAERAPLKVTGGPRRGRPTVTVAQMENSVFYNLVAEIVHGYQDARTDIVELAVTDYSVNEELYDYEEGQESARGIYGKRLLKISCWDGIAGNEAKIEEYKTTKGRVYRFDNVRIKTSTDGVLEGSISIQRNAEQHVEPIVRIHVVPAELLERRHEYFTERDRLAAGGEHAQVDVKMAPIFDGPDAPVKLVVAPIIPTTPAKLTIASNFGVKCDFLARPMSRIIDILRDKVDRRCYRIKAKIIAHTPIEDWVQAICPECDQLLPSGFINCAEHKKVELIYRISLILLDQPSIPDPPEELSEINVIISRADSHLVIPGLAPNEEMRQREGRRYAQLKARFEKVLNKSARGYDRDGPYFDMALRAIKTSGGKWLYRFEGTSFVGV